jgi:hypothetical protein
MKRFKARSFATGATNWGRHLSGAALEEYLATGWSLIKSILGLGIAVIAVLVLLGMASLSHLLSSPVAGLLGMVLTFIAAVPVIRNYRKMKRIFGRSLGLTPQEAQKLRLNGPEALDSSLNRILRVRRG